MDVAAFDPAAVEVDPAPLASRSLRVIVSQSELASRVTMCDTSGVPPAPLPPLLLTPAQTLSSSSALSSSLPSPNVTFSSNATFSPNALLPLSLPLLLPLLLALLPVLLMLLLALVLFFFAMCSLAGQGCAALAEWPLLLRVDSPRPLRMRGVLPLPGVLRDSVVLVRSRESVLPPGDAGADAQPADVPPADERLAARLQRSCSVSCTQEAARVRLRITRGRVG